MARFIITIMIGALSFGTIQLAIWTFQPLVFDNKQIQKITNARILIAGDSHGERIWLPNSVNISSSGDPLTFQVATIEKILAIEESKGLGAIIISVGPQNFSSTPVYRIERNLGKFIDGNVRRINFLKQCLPFNPLKIKHYISQGFPLSTSAPINLRTEQLLESDIDLSAQTTEAALTRHRVNQKHWFTRNRVSTTALEHLLNSSHKTLNILLIGTPIHQSYREKINPREFRKYKSYLDSLGFVNDHVTYLSFEESEFPDECFKDADHLNNQGTLQLCDSILLHIEGIHPGIQSLLFE